MPIIFQLKFTESDADIAHNEWGCNCGPAALAAILGKTLREIRPAVEAAGFAERRYTSPTMMQAAIASAGGKIVLRNAADPIIKRLPFAKHGLVRIQWCGPWTAPGANPKWAYRQTHWIATQIISGSGYVFDVNGGARSVESWIKEIVPPLSASIPRADGNWFITHSWEVAS